MTLSPHAARLSRIAVRELFARDPDRFANFSRELDGLLFDFSRQRLDAEALVALAAAAEAAGLRARIEAMFGGEIVNDSERRQALHTLLRASARAEVPAKLVPLYGAVQATRARLAAFVREVHTAKRQSATGARFTDVVNIGIGGSDLGPAMAVEALRPFHTGHLRCHFASNVDGTQFADLAQELDPARTLFVVCSKTFTTQETLANARRARAWIADRLGVAAVRAHFAAVSTNAAAMDEFDVAADARFEMWDWVGGRFSMWSAVGLAIELTIGSAHFEAMLAGARAMDEHFRTAPFLGNLPALAGLIAVWNRNALGCTSHAVLPYSERLARLPAYLQQLSMESLGKGVTRDGSPVVGDTGAVLWGEPASNAQHSFLQLLHQGTAQASMDFLLPIAAAADAAAAELVIANCLAQTQAFMAGYQTTDPQRRHAGSRPLSLLVFARLDPETLGRIVAFYEHQVFVQSVLWDINPFDQWGVELGKRLCGSLLPLAQATPPPELAGLAGWIARRR
ncbi:MAG: glucose-6-phosphate isomerase [Gammaproteobacteria bacterium]